MKEIPRSKPLDQKLAENETIKATPHQIYTMKDVLSTKQDTTVDEKSKIRMDSTVRVFKETRIKLNLLTKFIGDDNVDEAINKMFDDYVMTNLSKENRKLLLMMVEVEMNKTKKSN